MNKTMIVLVPLCCFLAACASSDIRHCPSGPTARECPLGADSNPDPDKRNKIRIHVTPAGVDVTPPVVCAHAGTSITATVTKADSVPDAAVVATVPKDAVDGWILSLRTGEGTMSIHVPESTPDDHYGYFAMASTGKCVDPMIHVD